MSNSIATRLILALCICTGTIISLGMALDYRVSRTELLENLRLESANTIQKSITDLENLFDGAEDGTRFLAKILQQQDFTEAQLQSLLRDIVDSNGDIYGAAIAINPDTVTSERGYAPYYYRRNGSIVYADLTEGEDFYWQRSWYSDAVRAAKPIWVEPYFDLEGGQALMTTFSAPVYRLDEEGNRSLFGVVTGDITLDELNHYVSNMKVGQSGYGFLLSGQGTILSTRDQTLRMRSYEEVITTDTQYWREILVGGLEGSSLVRTIDCPHIDGSCTVRMGSLDPVGWPVGVVYSQDEVLEPLYEYQLKMLATGIATLMLMSIAIYSITRRVTAPLTALAAASDSIALGDLSTSFPPAKYNDEIGRLVTSFSSMQRDLKVYIADLEDATASRSRLEGELAAAREIQMSMLPQGGEAQETCETYSLWAKVRPAKSVGGDLYTYYERHGELFVAVGDVSDKGVPAALFMAKAISLMQQLQEDFSEPNTGMAKLNDLLEQGNENCMFLTLFFGVLNLQTGTLRFASGGHTPPTLLQAGRATTLEQKSGPALGLATEQTFPINTVQLPAGSRLAIYTDGIDEAFDSEAQMFGTQRINAQIEKDVDQATASAGMSLFQAVDAFAGPTPQSDDITLLLLDWSAATLHAHEFAQQHALHLGPKLVTRANLWLEHVLEQAGVSPDVIMELTLVLEEMVTNVGKYSGLDQTSELQVLVAGNSAEISLEIQDQGSPFDPLSEARRAELGQDIDHAQVGGLGVHLITQLTQQQDYRREEGKNILRVIKQLDT
ncbi:MAG: SpoIIE family protein phosphatase [Halioglobus sp.]